MDFENTFRVSTPFHRVAALQVKGCLIGKRSKLYQVDLATMAPPTPFFDLTGDCYYRSDIAVTNAGEIICSNGSAIIACDLTGHSRELVHLQQLHGLDSLMGSGRHVNGLLRWSNDTGRVYFCVYPFDVGTVPPSGPLDHVLCEWNVRTMQCAFMPQVSFELFAEVDDVSRSVYFPPSGLEASTCAIIKRGFEGEGREALPVPGRITRCQLDEHRRQLLCSHDRVDGRIVLVQCAGRSKFRFWRRWKAIPFSGFNAVYAPNNCIYFLQEPFSLWHYSISTGERRAMMQLEPVSPPGKPAPMLGFPPTWTAVESWANAPLVHANPEIVCWQICTGENEFTVVLDIARNEYVAFHGGWPQMALLIGG